MSGHTAGARIGIVYPRAAVDSVPPICQAAELLARRGYQVDLLACVDAATPPPRFAEPNVRLVSLGPELPVEPTGSPPSASRPPRLAAKAILGRARGRLRAALRRLRAARARRLAAALVRRSQSHGGYRCFFGVDPDGLVLAAALARMVGAPYAYYSLELLLSNEIAAPRDAALKQHERALAPGALLCVLQDPARARLFTQDTDVEPGRVVLVPNAPLGPARRRPSRYWHQRFGLPAADRVVLHTGSLGDWTGIEQIVASAAGWPSGWHLVVHTRYDAASSAYVEALRRCAPSERVHFSLKPVPRQAYDALVDSAQVGIAFYLPGTGSTYTGSNIQEIGLSSGKIAYYLRSGLPVIVNRAASTGAIVERAGCGVAVDGASDIAEALTRIARDDAAFGDRACQFFDTHLDFARTFEHVMERLDGLTITREVAH